MCTVGIEACMDCSYFYHISLFYHQSVGFFSKVWKRLTKSSKQETASRCNRNDVSSTAL